MKTSIFLLAIIISAQLMAQSASKFSIGINYSTDYNYRNLVQENDSSQYLFIKEQYDSIDVPYIGFTAGLDIKYKLSEKLSLGTGIQYSVKGHQTKYDYLFFIDPAPDLPEQAKIMSKIYFIDIPVYLQYTIGENKLHFITSAGLTINYFLDYKNTQVLKYHDGHTEKLEMEIRHYDVRPVTLSPFIAAGVSWQMTEKLQLELEPTIRYGITKLNTEDDPISEHLWNAGINVALYFTL